MTLATVKTVAARFLESAEPEVLAINGAWGVGKTYAWNRLVEQCKGSLKLKKYCYVSLFGITSMQELRNKIFLNTHSVSRIGMKLNAEAINDEWAGIASDQGKKLFGSLRKWIEAAPYGKNITLGLETLAPLFNRDTIICFDDFERLNVAAVKPDEFLGLVSELKEEKNCKAIIIFNLKELTNPGVYEKYREKVVDFEVVFAPTSQEICDLALPENIEHRSLIQQCVISLSIKNIRVLRKIVRLVDTVRSELSALHPNVLEQAIKTLVLLIWAKYDTSDGKPSLDFVLKWNRLAWAMNAGKNKDSINHEARWAQVLDDYGYSSTDEFDRSIYDVILRGYIEETNFVEAAKSLDLSIRSNELEQSFTDAWKLFHNSFDNNQEKVIDALSSSFKKHAKNITPINLNGTVRVLRELDQGALANELIEYYLESHSENSKFLNLNTYSFQSEITDQTIRQRFQERYDIHHPLPALSAAVANILNGDWGSDNVSVLNSASEDDIFNLFKLDHGEALHRVVRTFLGFDGPGASKDVRERAKAALVRISEECLVNAARVRRFGIGT